MPNAPQACVHRDSSRVIRLEEVTRVDKQTFSHWNMSACLLFPPHAHTSENGSYCQRGWIEWNPVNSFSTICLNFDGNVNNSHLNLKRIHWHWQVVIAIIAIAVSICCHWLAIGCSFLEATNEQAAAVVENEAGKLRLGLRWFQETLICVQTSRFVLCAEK